MRIAPQWQIIHFIKYFLLFHCARSRIFMYIHSLSRTVLAVKFRLKTSTTTMWMYAVKIIYFNFAFAQSDEFPKQRAQAGALSLIHFCVKFCCIAHTLYTRIHIEISTKYILEIQNISYT